MKAFIISILVIFTFTIIKAENIVKYVWAPNGLNIREAPSINAPRIGVLQYGDAITVLEKTKYTYENDFVYASTDIPAPLTIKHNWVKIIKEGKTGYIIDGYLLEFIAPNNNQDITEYYTMLKNAYGINNIIENTDDTSLDTYQIAAKLPHQKSIKIQFEENVESCIFKNFNQQEVLIFLNHFYGIEKNIKYSGMERLSEDTFYLYIDENNIEVNILQNNIIKCYSSYEGC